MDITSEVMDITSEVISNTVISSNFLYTLYVGSVYDCIFPPMSNVV